MQMRLAFSVATARRPDVLIVDEAMSVGDAYFQHKSFERIRELRELGTTLLIVSHDKGAIQSICDRAILLDGGSLVKQGPPEEIMDYYNALISERENKTVRQTQREDGKTQTISGTGEAKVESIALYDDQDKQVEIIGVGNKVTLQITVSVHAPIERLVLGYMIKNRLGQPMYGTNTHHKAQPLENVKAGETITYRFAFPMNLGPGSYSIATALVSTETHLVNNYEWRDLALVFKVLNMRHEHFEGSVWLDPTLEIERPRISRTFCYGVRSSTWSTVSISTSAPTILRPIRLPRPFTITAGTALISSPCPNTNVNWHSKDRATSTWRSLPAPSTAR
jgi:lipopolysaccharide transport system ATP-binding protein